MLNLGDFHGVMSLPANLYEGLQFKITRKTRKLENVVVLHDDSLWCEFLWGIVVYSGVIGKLKHICNLRQ